MNYKKIISPGAAGDMQQILQNALKLKYEYFIITEKIMNNTIEKFAQKNTAELCSILNEIDNNKFNFNDISEIAPQKFRMIINTILFSKAEGLLFVKSFFRLYTDISNMIDYIAIKSIRSNSSNEHDPVIINADLEMPLFLAYLKTFFERLSEEEKNKWLENCKKFYDSLDYNFVGYAMFQIYIALHFLQDKDSSKKDEDSSENSSIDEDEQNAEKIREYMGDNTISGKDLSDKKASCPKAEEIISDLMKSTQEEKIKITALNILMKKIDTNSLSSNTNAVSLINETERIIGIINALNRIKHESEQKDSNYSTKSTIINDLIVQITSYNLYKAKKLFDDNKATLKEHEPTILLYLWNLILLAFNIMPTQPAYVTLIDNIDNTFNDLQNNQNIQDLSNHNSNPNNYQQFPVKFQD